MSIIKPFKALRPQPQLAKQVASKPYDVLSSSEAKVEAQGNPNSFLHITKSEIDLPENTDIHSEAVYTKAKENLQTFIKRDILFEENKACYYIYRLTMPALTANEKPHSQTGLVCVSSIEDYENGIIKKHEFTTPEKEQDRINHIKTTGAQTGNVFLAYRDVEEINKIITNYTSSKTGVYDFKSDDGVEHTIWVVNGSDIIEKITKAFETKVPNTYIADGHHRAASAAKVKQQLNGGVKAAADFFLTTLFPSSQLKILDYNRLIKTMNGHGGTEFLELLKSDFIIEDAGKQAYKPVKVHEFGLFINNNWYKLTAKEGSYTKKSPVDDLDIHILQQNILSKHLNMHDQRTDKNIQFVGGSRGLHELEKKVQGGDALMAFSLYPVTVHQLFSVADSENVMPPKSTWFEPKLRDGLLTHLIYE